MNWPKYPVMLTSAQMSDLHHILYRARGYWLYKKANSDDAEFRKTCNRYIEVASKAMREIEKTSMMITTGEVFVDESESCC